MPAIQVFEAMIKEKGFAETVNFLKDIYGKDFSNFSLDEMAIYDGLYTKLGREGARKINDADIKAQAVNKPVDVDRAVENIIKKM